MTGVTILLCSENIKLIKEFYEAIGVTCHEEQHGSGPVHFSLEAQMEAVEIYPPRKQVSAPVILRFNVEDVSASIAGLSEKFEESDFLVASLEELQTGMKAVVKDPDGRIVELFQPYPR
ncbi:MAG: hypothetical protein MRY79_03165 [Alphaproteobacteria bacterium]|nr:hypothetical protein [Alphaproteobacteria bacterium]